MQKSEFYRCGLEEVWQRETGKLHPIGFARKIGGCEDLIKRLEQYAELDGHTGCVNTVQFNPTGELLVSGSDDKDIVIWDWAAKTKTLSYDSGHKNNIFQARIMPFSDDRSIISCAADGQVRHGQILENGKVETQKLAKHRGSAHKLAIEPGSPRTFFSCAEDGVVRHFDLRENKNTKLFTCHTFQGSKSRRNVVRLHSIVINPRNPNYFSVGGSDEYARVYDMRKVDTDSSGGKDHPVDCFTPRHLAGSHDVHITCVAYSQQEELLISYCDELIYKFDKGMGMGDDPVAWEAENIKHRKAGRKDATSIGHDPLFWAPDNENGRDANDPETDGKEADESENEKDRKDAEESEDKKDDRAPEEGPQVYMGHRNAKTVKGVNFFGPNSEYVVSGSDCGHIYIWKKWGGKLLAMKMGDTQVVNCLEPHPFSTVLATSGVDQTVKIWSPTAEEIIPLPSDAEKIMDRNRRRREDRSQLSLRPSVIMHVMRLQRQQAQRDIDRHMRRNSFDEDNTDDSSDEGARMGPRECIIS